MPDARTWFPHHSKKLDGKPGKISIHTFSRLFNRSPWNLSSLEEPTSNGRQDIQPCGVPRHLTRLLPPAHETFKLYCAGDLLCKETSQNVVASEATFRQKVTREISVGEEMTPPSPLTGHSPESSKTFEDDEKEKKKDKRSSDHHPESSS